MIKLAEILFTPEATKRIQEKLPSFTGKQMFDEPVDVSVEENAVAVTCDDGDELTSYVYPIREISRIKVVQSK